MRDGERCVFARAAGSGVGVNLELLVHTKAVRFVFAPAAIAAKIVGCKQEAAAFAALLARFLTVAANKGAQRLRIVATGVCIQRSVGKMRRLIVL